MSDFNLIGNTSRIIDENEAAQPYCINRQANNIVHSTNITIEIPYSDKLQEIAIYSLNIREERYCLITIAAAISERLKFKHISIHEPITQNSRHGIKAEVVHLKEGKSAILRQFKKKYYAFTSVETFNSLPKEIREHISSKEGFKDKLNAFLSLVIRHDTLPHLTRASLHNLIRSYNVNLLQDFTV